jgi:hypothetical protein
MLNRAVITSIFISLTAVLFGQTPGPPSPMLTRSPSAKSTPSPSPTASVARTQELINSLGDDDLRAAISLLKSNFADPGAITEPELNRALLSGLLMRIPGALVLLPNRESAAPELTAPFYSETFENHIGYVRLGSLNSGNLKELDKALQDFASKKIDAMIVDLRASESGDFAAAAEFAKRFCPKGKPLFTLRKPAARQDRGFSSDRDPAFHGLLVVLIDGDTAGAAEAMAAALRAQTKALLIGQTTAGRAVEYSDQQLPSGKTIRIASAEAVLPDGQPLFPGGVKPDLPVELSAAAKREIFRLSSERGMSPFVYEAERPHLNEAALLAGTNPELEPSEAMRSGGRQRQPPHDSPLQRALDVVTSLEIYQKR